MPRSSVTAKPSTILLLLSASEFITPVSAQEAVLSDSTGKHPYDTALEYCADRGSLGAFYSDGEDYYFTCSDDLTAEIRVSG